VCIGTKVCTGGFSVGAGKGFANTPPIHVNMIRNGINFFIYIKVIISLVTLLRVLIEITQDQSQ
jgi:hypothetical protein